MGGYIYFQFVVNFNVVGVMFIDVEGVFSVRSVIGIVVVEVNQGDVVFVCIYFILGYVGNLRSDLVW